MQSYIGNKKSVRAKVEKKQDKTTKYEAVLKGETKPGVIKVEEIPG